MVMASAKIKTATLGGTVWDDVNHDGLQNDGNIGVAGVKVLLLNGDGKATGKFVISDANGNYSFAGLKPGEYSVKFDTTTLPSGANFTQKDAGHNNSIDSDVNVATGKTSEVELKAGDVNTSLDAGVVMPVQATSAIVNGHVWEDTNSNGLQDKGEPDLAGISVVFANTDLVTGGVTITSTDSHGNYSFADITPGIIYEVDMRPPFRSPTLQNTGSNDNLDSDINVFGRSDVFITQAGKTNTIDAGFTPLPSPGIVNGHVWDDTNRNGIQDAGEPAYVGAPITLSNIALLEGGIQTATTDSNGNYSFSAYPGDYVLYASTLAETLPHYITLQNVGSDDSVDSDMSPNGRSDVFTVHADQATTLDVGFAPILPFGVSAVRGVWYDINRDGVKEDNEPGVGGVTVTLVSSGADITNPSDDVLVGTTVTNAAGDYNFPNLDNKDLVYKLIYSNVPAGKEFTAQKVFHAIKFSTDPFDSDVNVISGESPYFSDFSGFPIFTQSAGLRDTLATSSFSGSRNRVWNDFDQDGLQNEAGVAGVTVELVKAGNDALFGTADDVVAKSTVTDVNGNYGFTDISKDLYQVRFSNIGDGFQFTRQDVTTTFGIFDPRDSDVNPATGYTQTLDLTRGEIVQYTAAGIYLAPVAALEMAAPVEIVGTSITALNDGLVA
jgi:serine-aspartate repeat-containing protein C/D/E